jgi:ribonuclease Z
VIAVTILGNNSAVPSHNRHPSAQVLQTAEHLVLIDCGEGTQMQMNLYKIKKSRINHIFISHLHGDHYFGLIGLLNSLALNNRLNDLHIYAPEKLKSIIAIQMDVAGSGLPFQLHFHPLEKEEILFEDKKFSAECFKVNHRIECWGFIFRENINLIKINSRLFFYAGGKEGDSMIPDMKRIEKEIQEHSASSVEEKIDPDAKHNEAAWRKYFPDFYEWTVEGVKN